MTINTGPANQKAVVLLDDFPQWLHVHERLLRDMPQMKYLDIASFTTDLEAAQFTNANASRIVGFIQDLNRDPSRQRDVSAGVRFLNEVIVPITPWARTIIVSGYMDLDDVGMILRSARYEVQFIAKERFETRTFRKYVRWLLKAQVGSKDNVSREAEPQVSSLLQVLEPPWDEVCRYIAEHPTFLHSMDPRMFEKLVAEIFKQYGWDVELNSRTRDGGYDIIAIRQTAPSNLRILIVAKRYAPNRPVGVEIVRSLYGLRPLHAVSQVVLATSSYISSAARKEFSRVIPWELDFIERERILNWCRENGGVELRGDLSSDHLTV